MITGLQYFGTKTHTPQQAAAADDLLGRANQLIQQAEEEGGFDSPLCPNTGNEISGSKGGSGDGGFRLPTATTGSGNSSHKVLPAADPDGAGVDVYDPAEKLDAYISQFETADGGNSLLEKYGLYREHPSATHGWCHLTTRAPNSGHRSFMP